MPIPPVPPLDQTIVPLQPGHIADHEAIHEALNNDTAPASHLVDTVDAHDASAVSFAPGGSIVATDVQTALAEVASERPLISTASTLYPVRWVGGPNASNSNDGTTAEKAFATIYKAFDAADVLGVAITIYVLPGATVGSPVDGGGIWLSDNATTQAVSGWRIARAYNIVGVGAGTTSQFQTKNRVTIANGGTKAATKPALLLDGCHRFHMENIVMSDWWNGAWIGFNHLFAQTGCFEVEFENCQFWYADFYSGSIPLTGVWSLRMGGRDNNSSNTFNVFFRQCGFLGGANRRNVQQPITAIDAFAAYITNASYIFFEGCTFELGGGVWFENAGNMPTDLSVTNCLLEGDFSFDGTPLLRFVGASQLTSKSYVAYNDSADTGASDGAYRFDEGNLTADQNVVISSNVRGNIIGPHTSIGNSNYYTDNTKSLLGQRGLGFERGHVVAGHDAFRRPFPGGYARFANLLPPDLSSGSYFDNGAIGGTTLAGAIADPYGYGQAWGMTPAAGAGSSDYVRATDIAKTFANNDRFVWGVFVRRLGTQSTQRITFDVRNAAAASIGAAGSTILRGRPGVGQWQWISGWHKISVVAGDNVGELRVNFYGSRVGGVVYVTEWAYPTLLYVPDSSGIGDEEVREMALHLTPLPFNSGVGSLAIVGGIPLSVPGGILDATNVPLGTATGSKFGTAATQKLGFWNATPVVQPAANPDTAGAALAALETEVNELKAALRTIGLIAT